MANMSLTLPYVSLRTFESVVRLRGFGRAAEELSVTQSAVSQHIKALEEWTGHQLLVRGPRETLATAEGQILADAVMRGLGMIEEVCTTLKSSATDNQELIIACPPGFAINWLFPRLLRFDQEFPKYSVSIATQSDPVGLATGHIDAAIQYGPSGIPGHHAEKLMGERVFPVCAPELAGGPRPLRQIGDLAQHTLLVDDLNANSGAPPTWEFWAESAGVTLPKTTRIRRFGQSNLVVQAARQGLGVALGREPLVIDALNDATLVRPFPQIAISEYAYWLVTPKKRAASKALTAFQGWLLHESSLQSDLPDPPSNGDANVRMD